MERARALQGGNSDRDNDDPVIVPAPVIIDDASSEGAVEVVMPDVDAMIDEITARATDPTRNPNVGNATAAIPAAARKITTVNWWSRAKTGARALVSASMSAIETGRRSNSRSAPDPVIPNVPVIVPRGSGNNSQECEDPFANLPEDMRPEGFPFNNC